MVTSHHVHLLAFDNAGRNVIPDSIKLVAGRTGQEYNIRKKRKGAFWEDRYPATAVEKDRVDIMKSRIPEKGRALLILIG
jgi:putative transposase